jgi:hypothetical protein
VWTELNRLEWGPVTAFCENSNKSRAAVKERRFLNQVEDY